MSRVTLVIVPACTSSYQPVMCSTGTVTSVTRDWYRTGAQNSASVAGWDISLRQCSLR